MVKLKQARLMNALRQRYQEGSTTDKCRTFDGLVALTPTTPSTRFAYSVRALHNRVYDDVHAGERAAARSLGRDVTIEALHHVRLRGRG